MQMAGIILKQTITMGLYMLMGFVLYRTGKLTKEGSRCIATMLLWLILPVVIIRSFLKPFSMDNLAALGFSFLLGGIAYVVAMVLSWLVYRKDPLDCFSSAFSNVGFMGIPVVQSIYGPDGVALLSMFILMFNLFFFSYGVLLISGGLKLNLKVLLNACIFSALLGLLFGVTGWRLPGPVENTLASIGSMNTPLAMMVIGASVAHSDIRKALTNMRMYRVCLLSMFLMPVLILMVVRFLPIDPMLAGICVLLAAMPIAGNCGMVSDIYTPDDMTASHSVMVSTLMSGLSLPLICTLISIAL